MEIIISSISWTVILAFIWTGSIRYTTSKIVAIITSLLPLCYEIHLSLPWNAAGLYFINSYFWLSPLILLTTHHLFSKGYEYVYGMRSDPGIWMTNRAKYMNRKLNIGNHLVIIVPVLISMTPLIINNYYS